MPLKIEVETESDGWTPLPRLMPGDNPASISHNPEDGTPRQVFMFHCLEDDSKSLIQRSVFGVDSVVRNVREIITKDWETVAELTQGESSTLEVKTDRSEKPRLVRFTHV